MLRFFRTAVLSVALALSALFASAGCVAPTTELISVQPLSSKAVEIPRAGEHTIDVRVTDMRNNKTDIGRNAVFSADRRIYQLRPDVPELVKGALELELVMRGFRIGTGGATLDVVVNDFHVAWMPYKGDHGAFARVMLDVAATSSDGAFTHKTSTDGGGRIMWIEGMGGQDVSYVAALALQKAMGNLFESVELIRVLMDTSPELFAPEPVDPMPGGIDDLDQLK